MADSAEEQKIAQEVLEGAENPSAKNGVAGFSSVDSAITYYMENSGQEYTDEAKKAIIDTLSNYAKLARRVLMIENTRRENKKIDLLKDKSETEYITDAVKYLVSENANHKIVYNDKDHKFDLTQFNQSGTYYQVYNILFIKNELQEFLSNLPQDTPHLDDIKEYMTAFVLEHSNNIRMSSAQKGLKGSTEFQAITKTLEDIKMNVKTVSFDKDKGLSFEYNTGVSNDLKTSFDKSLEKTNANQKLAKDKEKELDAKVETLGENPSQDSTDKGSDDEKEEVEEKKPEPKPFGQKIEPTLGEKLQKGFYNTKYLSKYIDNLLKTLADVMVYPIKQESTNIPKNDEGKTGQDDNGKDAKPKVYDRDGKEIEFDNSDPNNPKPTPEELEEIFNKGGFFLKDEQGKLFPMPLDIYMGMMGTMAGQKKYVDDLIKNSLFSVPGIIPQEQVSFNVSKIRETFGYQMVASIMNEKLMEAVDTKNTAQDEKELLLAKAQILENCQDCLKLLSSDANIPLNKITIKLPNETQEYNDLKKLLTDTLNVYQEKGIGDPEFKKHMEVIGKIQQVPAKDLILNSVPENCREPLYNALQSVCKGMERLTELFSQRDVKDMFEATKGNSHDFGGALSNDDLSKLKYCENLHSRSATLTMLMNATSGLERDLVVQAIQNKTGEFNAIAQLLAEQQKQASGGMTM